jgi:hypothetical protein
VYKKEAASLPRLRIDKYNYFYSNPILLRQARATFTGPTGEPARARTTDLESDVRNNDRREPARARENHYLRNDRLRGAG